MGEGGVDAERRINQKSLRKTSESQKDGMFFEEDSKKELKEPEA